MQYISYILVRAFIWILHVLPEKILYLISDVFYFIAFRVAGYRKKVVTDNLRRSFPDKDMKQIRQIRRKFYHHFCDFILESAISHFFTPDSALKRMSYDNPELLDELGDKGKIVLLAMGHYCNWEYFSSLPLVTKYPLLGIYKPLRNKYFDKMVTGSRERLGAVAVPMDRITRELIRYKSDGKPANAMFLTDQRPPLNNIHYWTKFLGQDTPMYLGTEKLARKLDAAVVFANIRKSSRGRYRTDFQLITDNPRSMGPNEITNAHVGILEDLIREAPEYWLWSHKRWKHSYEKFMKMKGQDLSGTD